MSKSTVINISIQQILQISIIPVLQQVLSTIVCSLVNNDIFGYYEIAKLFITGRFFELDNYCESYHYTITAEATKICQHLIRKNTYRTKLDICISTNKNSKIDSNVPPGISKEKCFCYDIFLTGELRIVSSSTYFVRLPAHFMLENRVYNELDTSIKCGFSSTAILRGEELCNKIIHVKPGPTALNDAIAKSREVLLWYVTSVNTHLVSLGHARLGFFKYNEHPHTTNHIDTLSTFGHLFHVYKFAIMGSVKIEVLHYLSSLKIVSEMYLEENGKTKYRKLEFIVGERFTLRYFE